MKIQSVRGVKDILPGEIEKWQWVESLAHEIFRQYGYREIRVPVFENTALFQRGIGDTTDIVEKEMYTFEDRSGDSITLRPEGTASVVRSYIEHKMHKDGGIQKLYYMGPMFRYERPQAGRFRQFYQIGVEAMGSSNPEVDAEALTMLIRFFKALNLKNLKLEINTLGSQESRANYREALKQAIQPNLSELCDNCKNRYERNPLRVLDCKVPGCSKIADTLPKIKDHLIAEDQKHFSKVQELLTQTETPFETNDRLVRGLDYYSRTTFEVTAEGLGAQNAVCGGGRYDSLVEEFDGPSTPCFGFAMGMERLVSVIPQEVGENVTKNPDVYLVTLGEAAQKSAFKLAHDLRSQGLHVERDFEGGSMKSQMRKANKANCRMALIIGDNEIASGRYVLKTMETGDQVEVEIDKLAETIKAG